MLKVGLGCGGLFSSATTLEAAASLRDTAALDQILQRLRDDYLATINPGNANAFLDRQAKDGSWGDIDYADRSSGRWQPAAHLERARSIAVGYSKTGNLLYMNPEASAAVAAAVQAWIARKPSSENWWHNTIGSQLALMPVLVLMGNHLPEELRVAGLGVLNDPTMVPPAQATGQNLVWYATQQVVRGALRHDANDAARASVLLQAAVAITHREGIQADFSFHQHGPQLYTGGYGLGLLMDSVRMARLLAGTPWAYSAETLGVLTAFALEGVRPLVRGQWLDWGARGREFTRLQGKLSRPQALLPALRDLAALAPARRDELTAFAKYIETAATTAPTLGNRHHWRSDFMVHQAANGYFSVRMVSVRTVGTEAGNGENLRGYWLPFGVTYLIRRGGEYDGLPAVWDWSRLPGITAPAEVPALAGLQRHEASFVGAVSDGRSGAAAMRLEKLGTAARKAWFFDGDLMVALGVDIGSDRDAPVVTTLNQTRWSTEVTTHKGAVGAGTHQLACGESTWVWHAGITYFLLGEGSATLALQEATGSGRDINAELGGGETSAKVLTLSLGHGVRPTYASYVYAVWMGAPDASLARGRPEFKVLENNRRQQSVLHAASGLVQAVVHEPTTVALDDMLSLSADQPCLLQVRPYSDHWQVSVADPTTLLAAVTLRLQRGGRRVAELEVRLAAEKSAGGKSVTARLNRPG